MSLDRKVFAAPARLWLNWPLWGGLLAMLLLAKHAWILFAPTDRAVPVTLSASQAATTGQLFGTVNTSTSTASLNGIQPIGIFASSKNGFAVMQTGNGQVGVGLGGQVAPGIKLVETHSDYVILESNGARHRVDLVKVPAAGGGIVPANNESPAASNAFANQNGQSRMLDHLTPEQRAILLHQQQELIRGRH